MSRHFHPRMTALTRLKTPAAPLRNVDISPFSLAGPAFQPARNEGRDGRRIHIIGKFNGGFGGQDERDGAKRRPSHCLHIVFGGAMPWRDGAVPAPSPCAVSVLGSAGLPISNQRPLLGRANATATR